jgi:hypothetical protein
MYLTFHGTISCFCEIKRAKDRFALHNFCLKLSHATCLQLDLYCVNQHTTHLCCCQVSRGVDLRSRMDLLPNEQNFDLDKSRQKFHHSLKEHHKISNIPKFRCEIL